MYRPKFASVRYREYLPFALPERVVGLRQICQPRVDRRSNSAMTTEL